MLEKGKIYIIEHLSPTDIQDSWGALLDLNMLIMTGGKERTLTQYQSLFNETGLELNTHQTDQTSGITVMTLEKQ